MISYLAALPSRDPVTARNQQITGEWWDARRNDYELRTSDIVLAEVRQGDPLLASWRLSLLHDVPVLSASNRKAATLASELLRFVPLPGKAHADALHIAVAAVNRMDYLLTWNCKHIANA
ncbi:MAG TPA: type II toxin-antitoxin system VapC family toxin, partial [Longimicrobium sp.]